MGLKVSVLICLSILIASCGSSVIKIGQNVSNVSSAQVNYSFQNDGRDLNANYLHDVYTFGTFPEPLKIEQCDLSTAIKRQRSYLLKKPATYTKKVGKLSVSRNDMLDSLSAVEQWSNNASSGVLNLNGYQISGKDNLGNVQFTGYFSPKIYVSKKRTFKYKYPIYKNPKLSKPMPSREQIDFEGALEGMGLELGYTDNLIDPFFMQIQGSGIVEFIESGEQFTFGYDGSNGHGYYSIGRYLVEQGYLTAAEVSLESIQRWLKRNPRKVREVLSLNASYVFFNQSKRLPTGSTGQPVTAYCSIAVDPNFIPYGATVLINRPVLDDQGELVGHTPSIFFAQDKGGAIKGSGRVDIYMGVGEQAQQASSSLKHYGSLWLLLPN